MDSLLRGKRIQCAFVRLMKHVWLSDLNVRVQNMIKQFLTLYSVDVPKWDNAVDLGRSLNWTGLVESTTSEFLLSQGVSAKYIDEVVEASTRVNYGQVSGLSCLCRRMLMLPQEC